MCTTLLVGASPGQPLDGSLSSTREGRVATDLEGYCVFINGVGADMLGYAPKDIIGLSLHEVVHRHTSDAGEPLTLVCESFYPNRLCQSVRIDDAVFRHLNGNAVRVSFLAVPLLAGSRRLGSLFTFVAR